MLPTFWRSLWLFLCLMMMNKVNSRSSIHCSSPSGSGEGRIVVEDEAGTLTEMTVVTWQIGLGETLCYRFSSETSPLAGIVEVNYASLKTVYSITDTYQFQMASGSAECVCDCPGGASHCSSHTNLCQDNANCIPYYSTNSAATGCFLSFLKLSSAMCCAIKVIPMTDAKYRALNLRVPSVLATFKTRYMDEHGNLVDSRTYNVDLNSGTTIDWDVSLQVSSPGPTGLVPPGWYVVPPDGQAASGHILLAGEEVNSLDGWDVDRLGWLKTGQSGQPVTEALDQLALRFQPIVESCASGQYSASFQSGKINVASPAGRPVQELFPFVKGVRVWRRHVEMEHRDSPLLSLSLQHRTKVGVVVQSPQSRVDNFTGILFQDKFSHLHLNLTVFNASGTLSGLVIGENSSQVFLLRLNGSLSVSNHIVRLSVSSCRNEQAQVNLHPLGQLNQTITRNLRCIVENTRVFKPVVPLGVKVASRSPVGAEGGWLDWLDPFTWASTTWNAPKITTTVIIGVLCILGIVLAIKLIKFCVSVCKCDC